MQRLKQGEAAVEEPSAAAELLERKETPEAHRRLVHLGIKVEGIDDVMVRLAKCCRPVPGDPIVGYISLGKGITIHHERCPNARALMKSPERFTDVAWEGDITSSFRVELQIDAWDRTASSRTSRAPSPSPASTSSRRAAPSCTRWSRTASWSRWGTPPSLKTCVTRLRNLESVFDAYRVTPTT